MKKRFAIVFSACLMAGCASSPVQMGGTAAGEKSMSPTEAVGQSALPPGATFRPENSLIIGSGDQWVGRVVADVGRDVEAAFHFFIDTYPAQGWTLISAVRGKSSLLVFTKQDRTATIELGEGGLIGGGSLALTVAPRNAAVVAPKRP
jgi:hypothetical protein